MRAEAARKARSAVHRWALACLLGCAAGVGCGPAKSPASGASSAAPLQRWQGPLAQLFDDSIHPAAVGLALDGRSPAGDLTLRLRAASAELVGRFALGSFTVNRVGAKTVYTLTVKLIEPPLAQPGTSERTFDLVLGPGSQGFEIVRTVEAQLREGSHTFVGFVHRFAGAEGAEAHFHLTADTPEVLAALQDEAALRAVQGDQNPP